MDRLLNELMEGYVEEPSRFAPGFTVEQGPGADLLGLHLRHLRHSAELTQEELAHRAELHWTYVSQVERGKRDISYKALRKLARGLDVAPSQVMPDRL